MDEAIALALKSPFHQKKTPHIHSFLPQVKNSPRLPKILMDFLVELNTSKFVFVFMSLINGVNSIRKLITNAVAI